MSSNKNPRNKVGRPTTYIRSMRNNPYWEDVKRAIRMRDNYRCTMCGKVGGYEVHHLTYTVDGVSIVGKELEHLMYLTLLCKECHNKAHSK